MRTSASSCSRSPAATSNTSSSCTWSSIREARPAARSARSTLSIATLMMSAADPWIGALSAIRSAISRRWRVLLVGSGRGGGGGGGGARLLPPGGGPPAPAGLVDEPAEVVADAAEGLEVLVHQRPG